MLFFVVGRGGSSFVVFVDVFLVVVRQPPAAEAASPAPRHITGSTVSSSSSARG